MKKIIEKATAKVSDLAGSETLGVVESNEEQVEQEKPKKKKSTPKPKNSQKKPKGKPKPAPAGKAKSSKANPPLDSEEIEEENVGYSVLNDLNIERNLEYNDETSPNACIDISVPFMFPGYCEKEMNALLSRIYVSYQSLLDTYERKCQDFDILLEETMRRTRRLEKAQYQNEISEKLAKSRENQERILSELAKVREENGALKEKVTTLNVEKKELEPIAKNYKKLKTTAQTLQRKNDQLSKQLAQEKNKVVATGVVSEKKRMPLKRMPISPEEKELEDLFNEPESKPKEEKKPKTKPAVIKQKEEVDEDDWF